MQDQNSSPASENQIREYYNSVYSKEARPNIKISAHYSRLASRIGLQKGQSVLDVACGQGNWLLAVDRMGVNPSGIDISHKAIDTCRTILPHGEFHVGSA